MVHFTVLPIHLYICTYNLFIRTHRHTPAGWWSSPAHCSSWTSLGGVSGGGWSSPCTHTWGSGWCGTQSGLHQTEHTQSASNSRTQTDTANTLPPSHTENYHHSVPLYDVLNLTHSYSQNCMRVTYIWNAPVHSTVDRATQTADIRIAEQCKLRKTDKGTLRFGTGNSVCLYALM